MSSSYSSSRRWVAFCAIAALTCGVVGAPRKSTSRAYCSAKNSDDGGEAHDRALALAQNGEYDESLWGFRRACELSPNKGSHWNDLGVTLLRLQRLPEAEACFLLALSLHDSTAHANLKATRDAMGARGIPTRAESYLLGADGSAVREAREATLRSSALSHEAAERAVVAAAGDCSSVTLPAKRLAPPLDAQSLAAFLNATGIRHSVKRLPRVQLRNLYLPENADYAAGRAPYVLVGACRSAPGGALERAGDPGALRVGAFRNDTSDFYPQGMPVAGTHPYLTPFAQAIEELLSPGSTPGNYPVPTSPRGGRYVHLNMDAAQWGAFFAGIGSDFKPPTPLTTPDAWLRDAFDGTPGGPRDEFLIGNHWRILLIGSEGGGMFFHADILQTGSWQLQIAGYKTWHLCAPSQGHLLSVDLDSFAPDYEAFPGALLLSCYLDVLEPGEMIYYPAAYWHQTLNSPKQPGGLAVAITDTIVDATNHRAVQRGLLDKCANPASFSRGGMTATACAALPRLFAWWDAAWGVCDPNPAVPCSIGARLRALPAAAQPTLE